MKDLHNLLKRQLKRHLNTDVESLDGPMLKFVQAVNDAYNDADIDRKMLERSLELSSAELMDANLSLTKILEDLEERVEARTAELRASQLALNESEERLRVLYEAAPVGIFQSLPGGRYLYVNRRLAKMYGYKSPEDLIGSVSSIARTVYVDPDEREWVHAQLMEQGRLIGYETLRRRKDGSTFWCSMSIQARFDPHIGRITHYDGFIIDITVRKEAEEKIKLALEAAEDANKSKSIFLANMSHEIRTPLNGIIGLAEVMLNTSLTGTQERFVKQLKSTSYSLLSVLNDILDFSKIEANKLVIGKGQVHIRELVAECLRLLYIQAREKGLELMFRIERDVPDIVEGDSDRIRQVILNIVSNAIKFTEFGEILVEVSFKRIDHNLGDLYFQIHDTGPGIAEEKIESVFNAFEQIDGSLTRSRGGTGLGLSISSQLVSLMGGKLTCTSKLGQGSTFRFMLPLRVFKDNDGEMLTLGREEMAGVRVLVADKNRTSRSIVAEILESWGADVEECDSSAIGLFKFEKAVNNNEPYRVVISDLELPGGDRDIFFRTVVQPSSDKGALVIMLGGGGNFDFDEGDLQANSFLYKPITSSDLFSSVMQAISEDSVLLSGPERSKVSVLVSSSPMKILLVEDTPLNQNVARYMIEGWGHKLTIAENGHEGFDEFISGDFDLILMDLQMPVMDGLESTGHIRAYEKKHGLKPTPILAMTAHALKGDAEVCLEAGMDDYISKPIDWKALFATLEQYTTDYPGKSEQKNIPFFAANNGDNPVGEETPTFEKLVSRFNDDEEFFFQMADILKMELPGRMEKICDAVSGRYFSFIELESHALKSMLGNFGKTGAYYASMKLEKAGHDKAGEDIDELYGVLERKVGSFMDHIMSLKQKNH